MNFCKQPVTFLSPTLSTGYHLFVFKKRKQLDFYMPLSYFILNMVKPVVVFKLDYKKDAENYWMTAHSKLKWDQKWQMVSDINGKITRKSWKRARNSLYSYLKKAYKKNDKILKLVLKQFEEAWRLIEDEYFRRIERITKRPVFTKRFTAYLTTTNRCPYSIKDNSFMLIFLSPTLSALRVCCHEIMHLQFHHYFWDRCR